jgi:hypothetical protein
VLSGGRTGCISVFLKVVYLENVIADMQSILRLYQQRTNETNTKREFLGWNFPLGFPLMEEFYFLANRLLEGKVTRQQVCTCGTGLYQTNCQTSSQSLVAYVRPNWSVFYFLHWSLPHISEQRSDKYTEPEGNRY